MMSRRALPQKESRNLDSVGVEGSSSFTVISNLVTSLGTNFKLGKQK